MPIRREHLSEELSAARFDEDDDDDGDDDDGDDGDDDDDDAC